MNLNAVEAELRAILVPYEDALETAEIYGIEVLRRSGAKAHDWFAGVQQVTGTVKFNFLPMHGHPELLEGCSPALLKHRTGASVFKFTELSDALIADLEALVARGFAAYLGPEKRTPR
ncbi:MAG: hypothetical protein ABI620_10430 [Chloroflexota bacterium]